jgi:tRNA(Ile)-lysidine synthase
LLRAGKTLAEIETRAEPVEATPVELAVPGETRAFGKVFTVRLLDAAPEEPLDLYCNPRRQVFDADTVAEPLVLRKRQPGDRFTPLGMNGSRRVKEYFIGLGLTRSQREDQALLTGPWGIVWVVGYAIAAHAAVTEKTTRWLEVEVDDAPL